MSNEISKYQWGEGQEYRGVYKSEPSAKKDALYKFRVSDRVVTIKKFSNSLGGYLQYALDVILHLQMYFNAWQQNKDIRNWIKEFNPESSAGVTSGKVGDLGKKDLRANVSPAVAFAAAAKDARAVLFARLADAAKDSRAVLFARVADADAAADAAAAAFAADAAAAADAIAAADAKD